MPDDSAEPLSASEIEKLRTRVAGSNYPHLDGGRELATIDALTEERDFWESKWDEAQNRIVGLETDKAHGMCLGCATQIAALTAERDDNRKWRDENREWAERTESQVAALSAQVEAYRGALTEITADRAISGGRAYVIALAALSDKEDPTK